MKFSVIIDKNYVECFFQINCAPLIFLAKYAKYGFTFVCLINDGAGENQPLAKALV